MGQISLASMMTDTFAVLGRERSEKAYKILSGNLYL